MNEHDRRERRAGIVRIALDARRHRALARFAADLDLVPASLALVWLTERIDSAMAMQTLGSMSPDLGGVDHETRPAAAGRTTVRGRAGRASRGDGSAQQGTLHEEIREVLAERREPMSVAQIAEEIRKRGRYRSPRAGRPISAAMVSRRVSNPNYRRLFRRNGRKITLGSGTPATNIS